MRIFEANKDRLNDPNKIQIGQELVIPPFVVDRDAGAAADRPGCFDGPAPPLADSEGGPRRPSDIGLTGGSDCLSL